MEKEARREWREEGKGSASSSSSSSSSLTYIHTHQAIVKANMFEQRVRKTSSPLSHALISTSTGASVCKQDLHNLPPFKLINSTQKKTRTEFQKKKRKKKQLIQNPSLSVICKPNCCDLISLQAVPFTPQSIRGALKSELGEQRRFVSNVGSSWVTSITVNRMGKRRRGRIKGKTKQKK